MANGGDAAVAEVKELVTKAAIGGAIVVTCVMFSKNIQVAAPRDSAREAVFANVWRG